MSIECYDVKCEYLNKNKCSREKCLYDLRTRMKHLGHKLTLSNQYCVLCGESMFTKQSILPCKGDCD